MEAHALFHQDGRGDRPLLAQDAEQQMLGADVVVQEAIGFFRGELQDPLGLGAERDLDRGRNLLAKDRAPFDFLADVLERQVRPGENPAGQALPFSDQAEKQVLRLDRDAPELARFVAGKKQYPPRSFRVPLEHPAAYVMKSKGETPTTLPTHYTARPGSPAPPRHANC